MHSSDQIEHEETARGGTDELKAQADALRRKIRGDDFTSAESRYSPGRKIVYFILLIGSIAGSTTLLIFDGVRQQLVTELVSEILETARPEGQAELFELPPPPPRAAEPRVVAGAPIIMSSGENEGVVLYSDSGPSITPGGSAEGGGTEEFTAPEITPATEEAYQLLLSSSPIMQQLVDGGLEEYQYREWQPVQNEAPRFVIDLLAVRSSDQQEVHLIWEVNLQEKQVQPLSQAARDLAVQRLSDP